MFLPIQLARPVQDEGQRLDDGPLERLVDEEAVAVGRRVPLPSIQLAQPWIEEQRGEAADYSELRGLAQRNSE